MTMKEAKQKYDDLKIQAMMFDMEVDIETWSLTPKSKSEPQPFWIQRYREKLDNGDVDQVYWDVDLE